MKYLVTFPNGDTRKVTADSVQEAARIMQASGDNIEGAKIRNLGCGKWKCRDICVCDTGDAM